MTANSPGGALESALTGLGIEVEVDETARQRLENLCEAVAGWGERINLSGHRDPESIATRLAVPALALADALPPWESLADVGSGAGFPGLPIAIRYPERRVILIEPRLKRYHFLRKMVRELALLNVEALRGRIEDLKPAPVDIALAQAMGPRETVAGLLAPWVKPGGWIGIPSGPEPPEFESPEEFEAVTLTRYLEAPEREVSVQLLRRARSRE